VREASFFLDLFFGISRASNISLYFFSLSKPIKNGFFFSESFFSDSSSMVSRSNQQVSRLIIVFELNNMPVEDSFLALVFFLVEEN
jgi:hypothetical protein